MLRRAQIEEACTFSGREATVTSGGFLTTEDISAPPYTKVFIVVHLDVVLSKFEGGRRPQITDPTHWQHQQNAKILSLLSRINAARSLFGTVDGDYCGKYHRARYMGDDHKGR